MSLAIIQGKLSRTEMKNIMAGSGGGCCSHNASWSYYNCGLSAAEAQKIECITKFKIVLA